MELTITTLKGAKHMDTVEYRMRDMDSRYSVN